MNRSIEKFFGGLFGIIYNIGTSIIGLIWDLCKKSRAVAIITLILLIAFIEAIRKGDVKEWLIQLVTSQLR